MVVNLLVYNVSEISVRVVRVAAELREERNPLQYFILIGELTGDVDSYWLPGLAHFIPALVTS